MTTCNSTHEINTIIKNVILSDITNPAFREKLKAIFCETVSSGELCFNLPDELKANNSQHTVSLITTSGYALTAHLDCGCCSCCRER